MLRNILHIAYRNFMRNKFSLFITIFGFAMGITCSLLLFMYLYNEYSFESMHKQRDRIYRLALTSQMDNKSTEFATTLPGLGPALQRAIPDIEKVVRIVNEFPKGYLRVDNNPNIKGENLLVIEPAFFDLFDFRFIAGDAAGMKNPNEIVLSEAMANRLFGSTQVAGKTVFLNNDRTKPLKVAGVVEGPPTNTHLRFDALMSWSTWLKEEEVWNDAYAYTYMLISPNARIEEVKQKIDKFVRENKFIAEVERALNARARTDIQPLADIHFHSHRYNELSENNSPGLLYIFLTIAIFFLLCSAFNYINIAIANSATRLKEIGMKKVFGAVKNQLRLQFFMESFLVVFISVVLAIVMTLLLLPGFAKLIGQQLELSMLNQPRFILLLLAIIVFVALVSGSYPSLYLASFSPVSLFNKKGTSTGGKGGLLSVRKVLIVIQLIISTGIIACTIIVVSQLKHVTKADIGFDKKNIVFFKVPVPAMLSLIKQQLAAEPEIVSMAASTYSPQRSSSDEYSVEQKDGSMAVYNLQKMHFDYAFADLMQMPIEKGRNFNRDFGSDYNNAFLVNEAMVKFFGWDDPIGKKINGVNIKKSGTIVGVVKDASLFSLHNKIAPMIMNLSADPVYDGEALFIRYKTTNIHGLIGKIKKRFDAAFNGEVPFEYSFLDESYDRLYRSDERYRQIILIGAFVMIFVSCLGLYGLSSFIANRRRTEIGVRKVLGASLYQIASLHIRQFFWLALIGGVLAWPLSYYVSWKWLQTFTIRIDIQFWVFLLSTLATILAVVATTAFHASRLSKVNPVDAIRE